METLVEYQVFRSEEEAQMLTDLLSKNEVSFSLVNHPFINPLQTDSEAMDLIAVMINKDDYEKVEKLVEKEAEDSLDHVEKDYFLHDFSDQELMEILTKPDEWGKFNYLLAQRLLKARGKEITKEQLIELKNQRLEELSKPEKASGTWTVIGYLFSLLGGFIGIIIGYFLMSSTTTLPNGEKSFIYDDKDRFHGKIMFFLGIGVFVLCLVGGYTYIID